MPINHGEVYKSLLTGSRPKRKHEQIGDFLKPYLSPRAPPVVVEDVQQVVAVNSIYATALADSAAPLADLRPPEGIEAGSDGGSQAALEGPSDPQPETSQEAKANQFWPLDKPAFVAMGHILGAPKQNGS